MPSVTNATPVKPSTVDYNSTVTYICQDGHSHTARDLTIGHIKVNFPGRFTRMFIVLIVTGRGVVCRMALIKQWIVSF